MLIYNNNGYLERLTHTGLKHLHILYIFSRFNTYNMYNTHTHARTHRVLYQGNGNEEKVSEKKGFQGRFKRTDRGRMT